MPFLTCKVSAGGRYYVVRGSARLNRSEYSNTIRDLLGVVFRADEEFPPDDSGYGFDNVGDVLTVSPALMQKGG